MNFPLNMIDSRSLVMAFICAAVLLVILFDLCKTFGSKNDSISCFLDTIILFNQVVFSPGTCHFIISRCLTPDNFTHQEEC